MRVVSSSAGPRCHPEPPGHSEGRHSVRALRPLSLLTALVALAFAAPAGTASAAPTGTHVIAALPDSSGLELSGYTDVSAGTALNVSIVRNTAVVGHGTSVIDGAGDGVINGGTNDCWTGVTPDILPGDSVEVTGSNFTDTMVVQDTGADAPVKDAVSGAILVHGHASGPNGAPLPAGGTVETRIVAGGFTDGRSSANGRQLRAATTGASFPLAFDAAGSANVTATYGGLPVGDQSIALSPTETRAIFANAAANEVTISQNPSLRGPTAPCTAPLVRTAITASTPGTINQAFVAAGSPATISGVAAGDVTAVSVKVPNGVDHAATLANGTWTAQVPASELAALPDGNVSVTATFTSANPATPASATLILVKDTAAPPMPVASPGAGMYVGIQSVTLEDSEPGAAIHYTTSGATPTAASTTSQPITLTASRTVKAIAIDRAGNASPVASFAYTIVQPSPTAAPPAGGGARTLPPGGAASADRTAPRLKLHLPGGGALLTGNRIAITLNADENALVTIRGAIGARKSGRLYRLKVLHRRFTKGRAAKVRLQVPPGALRPLQRALARNRVVAVNLTIKAVDASGNARTLTRSFRLSG
jgi:Chitobiase/beta-hexosaminidase C-terminal domain